MMKALEALVIAEVNKTVGNHTVQKCSNRTSFVSGSDRNGYDILCLLLAPKPGLSH